MNPPPRTESCCEPDASSNKTSATSVATTPATTTSRAPSGQAPAAPPARRTNRAPGLDALPSCVHFRASTCALAVDTRRQTVALVRTADMSAVAPAPRTIQRLNRVDPIGTRRVPPGSICMSDNAGRIDNGITSDARCARPSAAIDGSGAPYPSATSPLRSSEPQPTRGTSARHVQSHTTVLTRTPIRSRSAPYVPETASISGASQRALPVTASAFGKATNPPTGRLLVFPTTWRTIHMLPASSQTFFRKAGF